MPLLNGKFTLLTFSGKDDSVSYWRTKTLSMGSAKACDGCIYSDFVDKLHCIIKLTKDRQAILCNVALPGFITLMNNIPVKEPVMLLHRSILTIGNVSFRFEYPFFSRWYTKIGTKKMESTIKSPSVSIAKQTVSKVQSHETNIHFISPVKPSSSKTRAITPKNRLNDRPFITPTMSSSKGKLKYKMKPNLILSEKSKQVSFGPLLSPEQFDKELPPMIPLKKGDTPSWFTKEDDYPLSYQSLYNIAMNKKTPKRFSILRVDSCVPSSNMQLRSTEALTATSLENVPPKIRSDFSGSRNNSQSEYYEESLISNDNRKVLKSSDVRDHSGNEELSIDKDDRSLLTQSSLFSNISNSSKEMLVYKKKGRRSSFIENISTKSFNSSNIEKYNETRGLTSLKYNRETCLSGICKISQTPKNKKSSRLSHSQYLSRFHTYPSNLSHKIKTSFRQKEVKDDSTKEMNISSIYKVKGIERDGQVKTLHSMSLPIIKNYTNIPEYKSRSLPISGSLKRKKITSSGILSSKYLSNLKRIKEDKDVILKNLEKRLQNKTISDVNISSDLTKSVRILRNKSMSLSNTPLKTSSKRSVNDKDAKLIPKTHKSLRFTRSLYNKLGKLNQTELTLQTKNFKSNLYNSLLNKRYKSLCEQNVSSRKDNFLKKGLSVPSNGNNLYHLSKPDKIKKSQIRASLRLSDLKTSTNSYLDYSSDSVLIKKGNKSISNSKIVIGDPKFCSTPRCNIRDANINDYRSVDKLSSMEEASFKKQTEKIKINDNVPYNKFLLKSPTKATPLFTSCTVVLTPMDLTKIFSYSQIQRGRKSSLILRDTLKTDLSNSTNRRYSSFDSSLKASANSTKKGEKCQRNLRSSSLDMSSISRDKINSSVKVDNITSCYVEVIKDDTILHRNQNKKDMQDTSSNNVKISRRNRSNYQRINNIKNSSKKMNNEDHVLNNKKLKSSLTPKKYITRSYFRIPILSCNNNVKLQKSLTKDINVTNRRSRVSTNEKKSLFSSNTTINHRGREEPFINEKKSLFSSNTTINYRGREEPFILLSDLKNRVFQKFIKRYHLVIEDGILVSGDYKRNNEYNNVIMDDSLHLKDKTNSLSEDKTLSNELFKNMEVKKKLRKSKIKSQNEIVPSNIALRNKESLNEASKKKVIIKSGVINKLNDDKVLEAPFVRITRKRLLTGTIEVVSDEIMRKEMKTKTHKNKSNIKESEVKRSFIKNGKDKNYTKKNQKRTTLIRESLKLKDDKVSRKRVRKYNPSDKSYIERNKSKEDFIRIERNILQLRKRIVNEFPNLFNSPKILRLRSRQP